MKIGVIGPDTTVKVIKTVAERDIPDVQLLYACTEFFEESGELASKFQNSGTVDAILFSGPTNYSYALRRVSPVVPWGYLPHSRTAALQAFLTAQALYGSDLKAISVDRYDPQLLRATLDICGIQGAAIYQAPYEAEDLGFEHKLLEFHRDYYRRGLVSACFTSMEHIQAPLLAEGIPCIRTYPADEVIREQIYHLQLRNFSDQETRGKLAIITIRFDYVFDDEKNLLIREWEKMQYQNTFQERVYSLAQRMEAAVFNVGMGHFCVVTSRNMLINMFLKNGEHSKLMQFGRRGPECQVWVGIGMGNTMLEAKSRSAMALNRSVADRAGNSYLLEDEDHGVEKLDFGEPLPAELSAVHFAKRIGVSIETLEHLRQVLDRQNGPLTSEELARCMGITTRSVNRVVAILEEAGCVTTVGKRSAGKGRPARVMKITLPDYITNSEL
nr:helix-turn-helix domain-containing protein [uncultured Oscillibacter sp.]